MEDDIYKQQIVERFQKPKFKGELSTPVMESTETNPLCGDWVRFQLQDKNGKIVEAAWQGEGCAISLASADLLAEKLIDMSADDVLQITEEDILAMLGIELKPSRIKCAVLPMICVKKGMKA